MDNGNNYVIPPGGYAIVSADFFKEGNQLILFPSPGPGLIIVAKDAMNKPTHVFVANLSTGSQIEVAKLREILKKFPFDTHNALYIIGEEGIPLNHLIGDLIRDKNATTDFFPKQMDEPGVYVITGKLQTKGKKPGTDIYLIYTTNDLPIANPEDLSKPPMIGELREIEVKGKETEEKAKESSKPKPFWANFM